MATVAWPAALPLRVYGGGYQETRVDALLRTPLELGPAKVRRRHTATQQLRRLTIELHQSERAAWDAFLNSIAGGADAFTWKNPVTGATEKVRLLMPEGGITLQQAASRGPLRWTLQLELEIVP